MHAEYPPFCEATALSLSHTSPFFFLTLSLLLRPLASSPIVIENPKNEDLVLQIVGQNPAKLEHLLKFRIQRPLLHDGLENFLLIGEKKQHHEWITRSLIRRFGWEVFDLYQVDHERPSLDVKVEREVDERRIFLSC